MEDIIFEIKIQNPNNKSQGVTTSRVPIDSINELGFELCLDEILAQTKKSLLENIDKKFFEDVIKIES